MGRAIADNLHKVDPNKTAKDISYFSQHREEVEEKGVQEVAKAADHAVDAISKGADAFLGKLDKVAQDISGDDDDDDDGTSVKPIQIDMNKGPVKDIFGFLKTELG